MTEEKAPESEEKPTQYFIEVRDQKIEIGLPDPAKLATMRMVAMRLSRMNPQTVTGEEAVKGFQRMVQIVTSLPTDPLDREWIEDLLLSDEMDIEEAGKVMEAATVAWEKGGNRQQRRAARKTTRSRAASSAQ